MKPGPVAMSGTTTNKEAAVELSPQDIDRIAMRVKELLVASPAIQTPASAEPEMGPKELAQIIDHTVLKPEASRGDIERLCREAIENDFFSVCVNPTYVTLARDLLKGSGVDIACVVGFPLGAASPEIKALEARKAIREGATEIDMVVNIGALKSEDTDLVLRDIRGVVEACVERSALCKVILETSHSDVSLFFR